jgi:hypothetical protein
MRPSTRCNCLPLQRDLEQHCEAEEAHRGMLYGDQPSCTSTQDSCLYNSVYCISGDDNHDPLDLRDRDLPASSGNGTASTRGGCGVPPLRRQSNHVPLAGSAGIVCVWIFCYSFDQRSASKRILVSFSLAVWCVNSQYGVSMVCTQMVWCVVL